jgi:hypothetical protein
MTLKVTCRARFAGRRSSSKCGERDEMDGSPKGENAGCSRVNGAPRKRCDIDNAKRWAQPGSAGGIESIILPADLMLYVIHV